MFMRTVTLGSTGISTVQNAFGALPIQRCPYELPTPQLLRENWEDYKNVLAGKVQV